MPNLLENEAYSYSVAAIHMIGFLYCITLLAKTISSYYEDAEDEALSKQNSQHSAINSRSSLSVNTPTITLPTPSTRTPSIDKEPELSSQSTILVKTDQQITDELFRKKPISLNSNNSEVEIEEFQQRQTIFSAISVSLFALTLLFSTLYNVPFDTSVDPERHSLFNVLTRFSWVGGQSLCFWTFIERLNFVFKDTAYQIPSKYIQFFMASTAVFASGEVILSLFIILKVTSVVNMTYFVWIAMIESIVVKLPSSMLLSISMLNVWSRSKREHPLRSGRRFFSVLF